MGVNLARLGLRLDTVADPRLRPSGNLTLITNYPRLRPSGNMTLTLTLTLTLNQVGVLEGIDCNRLFCAARQSRWLAWRAGIHTDHASHVTLI